jgi:hypothetical protein
MLRRSKEGPMVDPGGSTLSAFELPQPFIEPLLRFLRLGNTALDALFYDVPVAVAELLWRGSVVVADGERGGAAGLSASGRAFSRLDLSALSNPEGSILVVDVRQPPYVTAYEDVPGFLAAAKARPPGAPWRHLSVTGVGSSALGSVAFAWDLSTGLGEPVAAIVPGYGVADVVQQALGGWFGLGLHQWWTKEVTQSFLAQAAPQTARIGRQLMMTAPGHTPAPVFEHGSGSSDVLHAILSDEAVPIEWLYGHSKGALVIGNATADLLPETRERLRIVTFGCSITETPPASYWQCLGFFDALGWLNSWGNQPEQSLPSHHSTNTAIPFSMPVALLAHLARARLARRNAPG